MLGAATTSIRFSNQGRSYKVIPQIVRTERRPSTRQTPAGDRRERPRWPDGPAFHLCDFEEHHRTARELNHASVAAQLGDDPRARYSSPGISKGSGAVAFSEDEAEEDPAGGQRRSTYAGELASWAQGRATRSARFNGRSPSS